jgi:hypothetical protein
MRLAPLQPLAQHRPAHRRDGPAPLRKPLRPCAPNHLAACGAADGLEARADEAASRVARGEARVARSLGTATPASVAVPSAGAPLGEAERLRLEWGFGADLRAVRVHHDEPAAAAARAEGARAFTAGRDIYFGRDRFAPGTADGFHLLAHEVAHVLQQTGREADCELRATDARGAGAVQRGGAP